MLCKKIVLVKPCWPYPYGKGEHTYNRIWPPLSLATCAARLEQQGLDIQILDAHALRIPAEKIGAHVQGYNKVFVTSSSLDRWQCPNIDIHPFLTAVETIQQITKDVYVLGYHGTVDPEGLLAQTGAKAVIRGAPEDAVAEICADRVFSQIKGLTWEAQGQICSTPDRLNSERADLPIPAFHLLNYKKYFYELLGNQFALFELGRGCRFGCKFCNKTMYGPGVRTKDINQIASELQVAIVKHGVKSGYFMDLEFLSDPELVEQVCDWLIAKDYNFHWCCQTRVDSLNPALLKRMKEAGCRLIHFGIESGLPKVLGLVGKKTSTADIRQGIAMCKEVGIKTLGIYLFGFAGETEQDREDSLNFAIESDTDYVSFHKVHPYVDKENVYLPDLAENKAIDRFIAKAYRSFYLRPAMLKNKDAIVLVRSLRLFLSRLATL